MDSPAQLTQKELELLAKLRALEEDRVKFIEIVRNKMKKLEQELEAKIQENARLLERNRELETNLKEISSLSGLNKNKGSNKSDDEDLLTRAKELLFEKTKICKNLENQLEALNNQVDATKEVLDITKSMLNLKNIENDHLQSRIESMELRIKGERDRFVLSEKKLVISKQKEFALTKEYETQRGIFKELQSTYEAKIKILTKQVETLKEKN